MCDLSALVPGSPPGSPGSRSQVSGPLLSTVIDIAGVDAFAMLFGFFWIIFNGEDFIDLNCFDMFRHLFRHDVSMAKVLEHLCLFDGIIGQQHPATSSNIQQHPATFSKTEVLVACLSALLFEVTAAKPLMASPAVPAICQAMGIW